MVDAMRTVCLSVLRILRVHIWIQCLAQVVQAVQSMQHVETRCISAVMLIPVFWKFFFAKRQERFVVGQKKVPISCQPLPGFVNFRC